MWQWSPIETSGPMIEECTVAWAPMLAPSSTTELSTLAPGRGGRDAHGPWAHQGRRQYLTIDRRAADRNQSRRPQGLPGLGAHGPFEDVERRLEVALRRPD